VTHYEVLGVPQTASTADVRRAFLNLARRFHPDVHVLADAATQRNAASRMRAVNDAWAQAEPAPSAGPADWRRHASPGPALGRPRWARLVPVVPVALLLGAVLLLGAGLVLRVPELGSFAVAVGMVAALAFVAAPILAMKEARRAQRTRRR